MNKGIDVEIIKDSTSWTGKRLTTFILKYPRYIHSELMTHRVFSKNSASSRAIPIERMIKNVKEDMVYPFWTFNQVGMQGKFIGDTDPNLVIQLDSDWFTKLNVVTGWAEYMSKQGIHKQNVNRLLEPWMHIKVILTGTDFDNWFELRNHPDAQPEIQSLARKMLNAMEESKPQYLNPGEWHIPFSDDLFDSKELITRSYNLLAANEGWTKKPEEKEIFDHLIKTILDISVARCARTSYYNFDGSKNDFNKDLELFHKLIISKPLHASPAEHQARVPTIREVVEGVLSLNTYVEFNSDTQYLDIKDLDNWDYNKIHFTTERGKYFSNLQGWIQYRKVLEEKFKTK